VSVIHKSTSEDGQSAPRPQDLFFPPLFDPQPRFFFPRLSGGPWGSGFPPFFYSSVPRKPTPTMSMRTRKNDGHAFGHTLADPSKSLEVPLFYTWSSPPLVQRNHSLRRRRDSREAQATPIRAAFSVDWTHIPSKFSRHPKLIKTPLLQSETSGRSFRNPPIHQSPQMRALRMEQLVHFLQSFDQLSRPRFLLRLCW